MSFYANNKSSSCCPGPINGNPLNGLCERVCIQTTKVFDSGMKRITETSIPITVTFTGTPTTPLTYEINSTDSEIIGKLVSGDFLSRTAVSDKGWSRLIYNGQTVYAVTSYLSNEVVSQPETPATPSDGFTAVDEQVTAKSETNLRTSPSTQNSEVVHLLTNGEYVRRIGIHTNGWSKLEYNGQIVYAITSYLTK